MKTRQRARSRSAIQAGKSLKGPGGGCHRGVNRETEGGGDQRRKIRKKGVSMRMGRFLRRGLRTREKENTNPSSSESH